MKGGEAAAHGVAHKGAGASIAAPEETWFHWVYLTVGIPDWLTVSILVAFGLVLFSLFLSRRLETFPKGVQTVVEMGVEFVDNLCQSVIGPRGRDYVPLIFTFFIYIFLLNLIGLIPGMMSPTAHPYITLGLAIASLLMVHFSAIRELGLKNYLLHYVDRPFRNVWGNIFFNFFTLGPFVHLLSQLARLISLSMRLFGNIFGEDTTIYQFALLGMLVGQAFLPSWVQVPLPFQLPVALLHLLVALVQAFIFSALTAVYIGLFIGHHEEEEEERASHQHPLKPAHQNL
ncbi:MAG: F0F1 ATP synthase subunit A [Armatimonadetes bacterium]|nr:F0F1 ATP synthase subunit A [Armatimonadota bacterium]MDW8122962.1 F0F1 ATP synthase subunit A [Armatimonadota bacterium]